VYGNAWVSDNARVFKDAEVSDNAWVYGDARVFGDAVYGDAKVFGNATVFGIARVFDNAEVYGDAWVHGNARVYGDARVFGKLKLEAGLFFGMRWSHDTEIKEMEVENGNYLVYKEEAEFGDDEEDEVDITIEGQTKRISRKSAKVLGLLDYQ
jgi:hypothetical protein